MQLTLVCMWSAPRPEQIQFGRNQHRSNLESLRHFNTRCRTYAPGSTICPQTIDWYASHTVFALGSLCECCVRQRYLGRIGHATNEFGKAIRVCRCGHRFRNQGSGGHQLLNHVLENPACMPDTVPKKQRFLSFTQRTLVFSAD